MFAQSDVLQFCIQAILNSLSDLVMSLILITFQLIVIEVLGEMITTAFNRDSMNGH